MCKKNKTFSETKEQQKKCIVLEMFDLSACMC